MHDIMRDIWQAARAKKVTCYHAHKGDNQIQTWRTKTMTKAVIRFALTIAHNFPSLYVRLLPIARQCGLVGRLTICKKG